MNQWSLYLHSACTPSWRAHGQLYLLYLFLQLSFAYCFILFPYVVLSVCPSVDVLTLCRSQNTVNVAASSAHWTSSAMLLVHTGQLTALRATLYQSSKRQSKEASTKKHVQMDQCKQFSLVNSPVTGEYESSGRAERTVTRPLVAPLTGDSSVGVPPPVQLYTAFG
jgi:hypothetical protein